jgi:phosphoribosylaminoimidazole-succinocarboxamide synthase
VLADSYLRSGKVRDLYRLNDGRVVLVASDRISAFDVVLPTLVPDKGRVLTAISRFWFAETASMIPNHLLDTDPAILASTLDMESRAAGHEPTDLGSLDRIRGRIMICRPADVVPIEAVVRGYLSGSGWKEYQERGTVCGIALPAGLRESDRLPEPIFTPATKAEQGEHDENVSFDGMIDHMAARWGGRTDLAGPACGCTATAPPLRRVAGSSWPTPSSSSVMP